MNNANVFKMKKRFELRLDYIIPSLMFLEEGFLEQMIGRKTKLSVKKKKFRKFRAYYLHTPLGSATMM